MPRDYRLLLDTLVFEPELSASEVSRLQRSSDPWEALANLVYCASHGDFSGLAQVEQLMRSFDSALFWDAATSFVGVAGTWSTVEGIARSFLRERYHLGVQNYVSNMLVYACNPSFAEMLLTLYEAAEDDDARRHLARNMSLLLEPGTGPISAGAPETDKYDDEEYEEGQEPDFAAMSAEELFAKVRHYDAYRDLVFAIRDAVLTTCADPRAAVFEGNQLDAIGLTRTLIARMASPKGPAGVDEGTWLLAAMIGKDARGVLSPLATLGPGALLEYVLDDPAVRNFIPGQRYFFGHPVPD